ncbi:hypothetical protein MKZ38_005553 [Zalerion maritima]|uniref:pectinesterase n=1 Tax=Zalerion maritima TaxID=339359 RepID=A0AAD5RJZ9_9PEZI|nr:hypothetical protein MKZ38_005553 [Zalerion maritima]
MGFGEAENNLGEPASKTTCHHDAPSSDPRAAFRFPGQMIEFRSEAGGQDTTRHGRHAVPELLDLSLLSKADQQTNGEVYTKRSNLPRATTMKPLPIFSGLISLAAALPSSSLGTGTGTGTSKRTLSQSLCQLQTSPHPLLGCPKGTILVSPSGSGDFTSIQSAIASLPNDTSSHTILVQPANYSEQLNVTRPGPLTILGGTTFKSLLSGENLVKVHHSAANHDSSGKIQDNYFTSVLAVAPNMNASLTGNGPTGFDVPNDTPWGSSDFRAYDMDFVNGNEGAEWSNGPALAVNVARANGGFYGCGFYSWQDTVFIGKLGNAYFYDCKVAGQTDFLYGFGTLYIEKSELLLRSCGGGIAAWKGANTSFENGYGVYISDSSVVAANKSIASEIYHSCPLGRPWNALHRSVFMNSYFDASILPAGYVIWSESDARSGENTTMAVYKDYGPGWNVTALEESSKVTTVLTKEEAKEYRQPQDVFMDENGEPNWGWIDGLYL